MRCLYARVQSNDAWRSRQDIVQMWYQMDVGSGSRQSFV